MEKREPGFYLPDHLDKALLVGRIWRKTHQYEGPSVVIVKEGQVFDVTVFAPTTADLLEREDIVSFVRNVDVECLGPVDALVAGTLSGNAAIENRIIAPNDLQAIKACGVTFAVSLIERVIEEQARGNVAQATRIRMEFSSILGGDLSRIRPGSPEAGALKEELQRRGAWSQYMEVGIGPDAEIFTKSQPMSAVGFNSEVGLLPISNWNNPEPEIVLAVDSRGSIKGSTLGNDLNLRDIEGRSALLLGKCKDNNASCAIGPFIRLFDDDFNLDSVRNASVSLTVEGDDDDFVLNGISHMSEISRDPLDLVSQTWGKHHQYPDGFMLFLGTMFSPVQDRDTLDGGFTHHLGDRVTISSSALGALVNTVQLSTQVEPWQFGVRALYANLRSRGI